MAADRNWGIGYKGGLPWGDPIKGDMKFFREKTMGHPIIMGKKTMESLGDKFPLKGRVNIVLSNTLRDPGDGSYFVERGEDYAISRSWITSDKNFENTEVFVIGGGEIFKSFLPMMSGMFITIVNGNFKSDTFFNPFSDAKIIEELSSEVVWEGPDYKVTYIDFGQNDLTEIDYYLDFIDFDKLEKQVENEREKEDTRKCCHNLSSYVKKCIGRDEISVRELKEYFQTPSVVNRYLDEYNNKTVFDIDESYFYNVGSTVENALLVHDDEIPDGYSEIDREDIRNILKKNRELKDRKQKPKNHTYVGGRVSVRELKKYFGVNLVSYGIGGSPLKDTEVIDLRADIRFYFNGNSIVFSYLKLSDHLEEISMDEVLNSIVKNIHRSTYLAEEIMDAYGVEELLNSNGSPISRCDIIDLAENTLIRYYWGRDSFKVVNRNHPVPEDYLRLDDTDVFMEKFLIEKWDGYSGQKVRKTPEKSKGEEKVEGDNPISPSYYESDKIKLREVLDQNLSRVKDGALAFYLGNTWKYLWRWDRKENPIQDLKKAKKYIDFAVDRLNEIDLEERIY